MDDGAQCVMTAGTTQMLELSAISLALKVHVTDEEMVPSFHVFFSLKGHLLNTQLTILLLYNLCAKCTQI